MPQGQEELCDSVRYFYCPVVKAEKAGLVWGRWGRLLVSPGNGGAGAELKYFLERARNTSEVLRMQL